jgi:hypothetical protein
MQHWLLLLLLCSCGAWLQPRGATTKAVSLHMQRWLLLLLGGSWGAWLRPRGSPV